MEKLITIKTLKEPNEFKFKEKGSLFIGSIYPIASINEAEEILAEKRKKHYDATHNCYAYRVNEEGEKYSDDGEPNGTAGIRIMNAINKFELTNVIIIVTRYFGGTKLGVGPLGKAYYESALNSIDKSSIITLTQFSEIIIEFKYDNISQVHKLLNDYNAKQITNKYEPSPAIECCIITGYVNGFREKLAEMTNAKAILNETGKFLFINTTND